ncbi:MAG TPA: nucleoside-diphosphate sugar epimerase/dehydratase [Rubricoccaceae bacterium]|nr:nucleoside-diphosphate sugar epimerase/dehydratase [Rubricoccaceae bacterium]
MFRLPTGHRLPLAKFVTDLALWTAATPLAFLLRLDARVVQYGPELLALVLVGLPFEALAIYLLGLPWRSWQKVGVRDLFGLLQGVGGVTVGVTATCFFLAPALQVPRGVPLIAALLAVFLLSGVRLGTRLYAESRARRASGGARDAKKVLIVGAGEAGTLIARDMLRHPQARYVPVGFLDDDPSKRRKSFLGLGVLGAIEDLPEVLATYRVDEVLIALPSAGGRVIRRIVELAREAKVAHRIIPGVYEIVSGKATINEIREVDVEDLLRREPVRLETDEIADYIRGRVVLVTGAGGSIGSELARQVAAFGPEALLLLGRGENSVFQIDRELARAHPDVARHALIVDVRDRGSLRAVFERFRPEVVFHAAAHKHVPLMEANPEQAVFNNVGGTRNLAELALEFGVARFVNVSTDKAVNPTSVMGASKRVAELVVLQASRRCAPEQAFVSVRFGNVLGSRGSVIPVFKEQIRSGGPVTVTHPDMVRYFMTIPEAAQLVLQAGSMADNGTVYVLDMGDPVRIVDLARDLILLCGKEPGHDVEIVFTGVRPGEKLFEELLLAEEGTLPSVHEKIFVARKQERLGGSLFDRLLGDLFDAASEHDGARLRATFQALVPAYTPPDANGAPAAPSAAPPAEPDAAEPVEAEPVEAAEVDEPAGARAAVGVA